MNTNIKMMKNLFAYSLLIVVFFTQCESTQKMNNGVEKVTSHKYIKNDTLYSNMRFPVDLVLLYHGGTDYHFWTKEKLNPYIYRFKGQNLQWQFDGFLFLDLKMKLDGKTYYFDGDEKRGDAMANKKAWKVWLNRVFSKDKHSLQNLEELLQELKEDGYKAPYKRKVIMTIPYPKRKEIGWGSLNGVALDFHNDSSRLQAANWYINQTIEKWNQSAFKNIELAGFYWIREEAFSPYDRKVIRGVSNYIKEINKKTNMKYSFYWIPYNSRRSHADEWRDLGFDITYFQPNYFFSIDYPKSRITGALEYAEKYGMNMEMEFNGKIYRDKNKYLPRFYEYLDEFEKNKVWQNTRVAYYEGEGAWYKMSESQDIDVKKAYNTLADILAERKKKYKKHR